MLVGEVVRGLGEPGRRVGLLQERDLVTAAQVPVPPPDDTHLHIGGAVLGDALHEPGQLAGRAVVLATDRLPGRRLRRVSAVHRYGKPFLGGWCLSRVAVHQVS